MISIVRLLHALVVIAMMTSTVDAQSCLPLGEFCYVPDSGV